MTTIYTKIVYKTTVELQFDNSFTSVFLLVKRMYNSLIMLLFR